MTTREPEREREHASLRLVGGRCNDDRSVTVDALVSRSDGSDRWGSPGTPVALLLGLPESPWMAETLGQLLTDWAAEDVMVDVTVVRARMHPVAQIAHRESLVSLEVLDTKDRRR